MTSDEISKLARQAGFTYEDHHSIYANLAYLAEMCAITERRKHQADIERWKAEAATAEKWRGLALSKDGDGRCVERIQQEAAEKEREACAALCDDMVQEEEGKLVRDYSREGAAMELRTLIRTRGQQ